MKDDKELTRVQCGQCAWMSEPHESVAEAYLEALAHFANVHRYADTVPPSEPAPWSAKRKKRVVLPFGPFEDPATCDHAWEPRVWERGKKYCPYCKSIRPATP